MLAFNSSDAPPPAPPRPTLTEKSFGDDDAEAGAPYYERSLQVDAAARQRRYDDEDAASARLAGGAAALACVFVVGGVALSFRGAYAARRFDRSASAGHALLAAALLGALGACGACVVACCGALGPALDDGGPVEEPAWYFRRRSARRLRRDARGALRRVSRDDGEEELAPSGGEDDVERALRRREGRERDVEAKRRGADRAAADAAMQATLAAMEAPPKEEGARWWWPFDGTADEKKRDAKKPALPELAGETTASIRALFERPRAFVVRVRGGVRGRLESFL